MPFYPIFPSPFATFLALGAVLVTMLALLGGAVRLKLLSPQTTRRLAHVLTGAVIFFLPFIFQKAVYPLSAAMAFVLLNMVSIRYGHLQGIHAVDRQSYGTVYFPLAYALLVWLLWYENPVALQVAVLLLALCDPMAGWVGQRWGQQPFTLWSDAKSPIGTATMWISSALVVGLGLHLLLPVAGQLPWSFARMVIAIFLIASSATIAEIISRRGSDNISVPLTGGLFVALIAAYPETQLAQLVLWVVGSALLLAVATRMGSLSWSGMLAAWVMGSAIFLSGGWTWLAPMLVFFITGSFLSHMGAPKEVPSRPQRDVRQVMANGGVPLLLASWAIFAGDGNYYTIYLAAIAAAAADTWATELGRWSKRPPRDVVTREVVAIGTSGGVTWLGSFGSLLGAMAIALAGRSLDGATVGTAAVMLIVGIGFGAAVLDSLLGSTLQARYRNANGGVSEQRLSGQPTITVSGWGWLDNNMVNFLHSGVAAITAYFLMQLLAR